MIFAKLNNQLYHILIKENEGEWREAGIKRSSKSLSTWFLPTGRENLEYSGMLFEEICNKNDWKIYEENK